MNKTKIGIITATRAEYGILRPLIFSLLKEDSFEIQLVATGTHLLKKYGHTVEEIERDGVPIAHRISIMDEEGNEQCKTVARATAEFHSLFEKEKYDAIILLGDRYELFGFAVPALLHSIPIVHLHGGEVTFGAIDESVRHAITKMSAVHFPSIEENAARIIHLGERPEYVFAVGALGIDNIMSQQLLTKEELGEQLGFDFSLPTALVTFQPVTTESIEENVEHADEVFAALNESGLQCVVTMPNSDPSGDEVMAVANKYINARPDKFKFFASLGTKRYLSTIKHCSMLVGNTSSGIIEAPSFGVPTVNVGERQAGRFSPATVIHCPSDKRSVLSAIEKAESAEFLDSINGYVNPYGDGHTAQRITEIMKKIDWKSPDLLKKTFYEGKNEQ